MDLEEDYGETRAVQEEQIGPTQLEVAKNALTNANLENTNEPDSEIAGVNATEDDEDNLGDNLHPPMVLDDEESDNDDNDGSSDGDSDDDMDFGAANDGHNSDVEQDDDESVESA